MSTKQDIVKIPEPSDEQAKCLDYVKNDYNVNASAVAGAGKSTLLLLAAHREPHKRFTLLTYSKKLQLDTLHKIKHMKLSNVTAFTYHGAASAFFGRVIYDDQRLIAALQEFKAAEEGLLSSRAKPMTTMLTSKATSDTTETTSTKPKSNYVLNSEREKFTQGECDLDVLMLDEVQDMTPAYYKFVSVLMQFINLTCTPCTPTQTSENLMMPILQLIVCGDFRQCINQYIGSRSEFLTHCHELFTTFCKIDSVPRQRQWAFTSLSKSYRLTPANAQFVNQHILNTPKFVKGLNTRCHDIKPTYLLLNFSTGAKSLAVEVNRCLAKYGPQGIVILVPSVRNIKTNKGPLGKLIRDELRVPLHIASRDDEVVDETLLTGKLLITTFNSMKGCERNCVFVNGLDESYFKYYCQDWTLPKSVPNILYVCTTRAIQEMVLVATEKLPLRTLNTSTLLHDTTVKRYDPKKRTNVVLNRLPKAMTDAVATIQSELQNKNNTVDDDEKDINDDEEHDLDVDDDFFVSTSDLKQKGKSSENANRITTIQDTPISTKTEQVDVVDLFAHVDPELLFQMKQLLTVECMDLDAKLYNTKAYSELVKPLHVTTMIAFDNANNTAKHMSKNARTIVPTTTTENVNELYTMVIPALAEFKQCGRSTFGSIVMDISGAKPVRNLFKSNSNLSSEDNFWKTAKATYLISPTRRTLEQWFILAAGTNALVNGRHHIARQVTHYKWIDQTFVDAAVARVASQIRNCPGQFNKDSFITVKSTVTPMNAATTTGTKVEIYASADFVADNKSVIRQFKCCRQSSIKDEYLLQLACLSIIFQIRNAPNTANTCSSSTENCYVGHIHTILDNKTIRVSISESNAERLLQLAVSKFVKRDKSIYEVLDDFEKLFNEGPVGQQTIDYKLKFIALTKPATINASEIRL